MKTERSKAAGFVLALFFLLALTACGSGKTPGEQDLENARRSFDNGFFLEAEAGYERYLQLEPQGKHRKEAWSRLLDIALNIKADLDRSVALLEAMYLEQGSDRSEASDIMFRLGDLYQQLGNRDKALESYEKSLRLSEGQPSRMVRVQLKLARIYRMQGSYDQVLKTLSNCAEIATVPEEKAHCLYELAQSYSLINSWSQVQRAVDQLLNMNDAPEDLKAMGIFLLADMYEHEHDYDKARELLTSIRDTYPNPLVIDARLKHLKK